MSIRSGMRSAAVVAAVGVIAALGLALPAAAAPPPGTELVINGNFAQPQVATHQPVASLPGWTLIGGSAEIDGASVFTPPAGSAPGTQSTDLNGYG